MREKEWRQGERGRRRNENENKNKNKNENEKNNEKGILGQEMGRGEGKRREEGRWKLGREQEYGKQDSGKGILVTGMLERECWNKSVGTGVWEEGSVGRGECGKRGVWEEGSVRRGECEKRRVRTGRCEAESRSERGDGEWEKGKKSKEGERRQRERLRGKWREERGR
jgi:hypothetical protein